MTDARFARSPAGDDPERTMLGREQRRWFEQELLAADETHAVVLWVNSVPWVAETVEDEDDWGGYARERAEIADFIAEHDIDRLVMLSGDAHIVALDDGTNSDYSATGDAGFPVLHAAALDKEGCIKGGPYSDGNFPGSGQFGVVDVIDDGGAEVVVELSGRSEDAGELVARRFIFDVPAGR